MGTLNEDLTGIKAIEDKLTANKVANFAYTDHAYENPLTEADGVEYYDVNNEQNIPVPDPSIMDVNETVLTKGFRSQASSIPRMLMNHFLGRVSYNLNKLNDNMSSLLATLMSHLGSANGIAPLNADGLLDIAKGGTNASTVNGARTNLNINNVVNTGDSENVASGGTAKFTTGGAYSLLTSIAPYFSSSTAYSVGQLITYQNKLYECTTAHSAGAWNAGHFTARSVEYVINSYILPSLAPAFSTSTSYSVGDFVIYQNQLYKCTTAHSAGNWNSSHFTLATLASITSIAGVTGVKGNSEATYRKGNVNITPADMGLGSVVNTGDSATPVSGGTTKFTTGGAYTELGKKVNGYTINYTNNQPTIPTNKYVLIFERTTPATYYALALHLTGEFGKISNTNKQIFDILIDFRSAQYGVILNAVTNKKQNIFDVIATWDNDTSTARVYLEIKDGYASASINAIDGMRLLDTLTTSSSMLGTSSSMTFLSQYTVVQENVKDSLAPNFSTSTSYSVGDYVLYDSLLYKCTTAHSAGTWNSSHFTAVKIGDYLKDKDEVMKSLPTDAILHYSFDNLPDFPDGSAIYYKNKNWTSVDGWIDFSGNGTVSIENGILTSTRTSSELSSFEKSFTISNRTVVKLVLRDSSNTTVNIYFKLPNNTWALASEVNLKANVPQTVILQALDNYSEIMLRNNSNVGAGRLQMEAIYIGSGAYVTNVIDNANNQYTLRNYGAVSTEGVSGKCAYFLRDKYADLGNTLQLSPNFTISLWVNPNNNDTGLQSDIIAHYTQLILRNGATWGDYLMLYLYGENGTAILNGANIGSLLTPNTWTHLVIVRDGTGLKVYRNGSVDATFSLSSSAISNNSTSWTLSGSSGVSNQRPQKIDDLLIFNRALSGTEVKALYYNKANTPKYFLGNSDLPAPSGNVPFTTGGAYNLLTSLAPIFNTATSYAVGDMVTYNGVLYICTTAHSAGVWNTSHFTVSNLNTEFQKPANNIAEDFQINKAYEKGQLVIYNKELYKCKQTTYIQLTAWDATYFQKVSMYTKSSDRATSLTRYVLNVSLGGQTRLASLPALCAGSELLLRLDNDNNRSGEIKLEAYHAYTLGVTYSDGGMSTLQKLTSGQELSVTVPANSYLEVSVNYIDVDGDGLASFAMFTYPIPSVTNS